MSWCRSVLMSSLLAALPSMGCTSDVSGDGPERETSPAQAQSTQDSGASVQDGSVQMTHADASTPGSDPGTPHPPTQPTAASDAGPVRDAGAPIATRDGGPSSSADAGKPGKACGARAGDTCAASEYCSFAAAAICGDADAEGVCTKRPTICPNDALEVCGCDGKTYPNDCYAERAGTSVRSQGACGTGSGVGAGKTCGGIAALQCATGMFCDYAQGQGCDGKVADAAGVCAMVPQVCTKNLLPVCGCDAHTYNNECEAHAAGTAVNHSGACK